MKMFKNNNELTLTDMLTDMPMPYVIIGIP